MLWGWGGREGNTTGRIFNNSVNTGQSVDIYKVWFPLGITVNRQETSTRREQVSKITISKGVKEQRKTCAKLQVSKKRTLANGGLVTTHPGEKQTQKY